MKPPPFIKSVDAIAPAMIVEGDMELIVGTGFASGVGVGVDPPVVQPESKSADVKSRRQAHVYLGSPSGRGLGSTRMVLSVVGRNG